MNRYIKTAHMAAIAKTNGGVLYMLPDLFIKAFTLLAQISLWWVVMSADVNVGMTFAQMLSYTYAGALLKDFLVVRTPATGWLSEGVLLGLYGRPLLILGQLAAISLGGYIPMLLAFSVPMFLLSPLLGVELVPRSPLFLLSLLLCISLGFAVDILFACLCIKMRNVSWLVDRIREAITLLLSGTVIPIALLPSGFSQVLRYQPFASLGGAPLSVLVGLGDARELVLTQLAWNLILWPLAIYIFRKSQEGVVSYGG
ncbi:hypothetical protein LJB77_01790 [Ruminococcaceae bacterium OttesenSCG-928-N02]|nr:hypothetical protein [Ruminococcaceae bacterium OttesenSCG-928-N02]